MLRFRSATADVPCVPLTKDARLTRLRGDHGELLYRLATSWVGSLVEPGFWQRKEVLQRLQDRSFKVGGNHW